MERQAVRLVVTYRWLGLGAVKTAVTILWSPRTGPHVALTSGVRNQIGSRDRRRRTAAAIHAAANANPIHRPGAVRNLTGSSCASWSRIPPPPDSFGWATKAS